MKSNQDLVEKSLNEKGVEIKNLGGRPIVFNRSDLVNAVYIYIRKVKIDHNKFPSITDFAVEYGINKSHLWDLASKKDKDTGELINPELAEAFSKIKELQEIKLMQNGLSENWNPGFAKFLLTVNHGLKETVINEHTGANGGAIAVENAGSPDYIEFLEFKKKQQKNKAEEDFPV